MKNSLPVFFSILSACCFGLGWYYPTTTTCAVLGWSAALFFVLFLTSLRGNRGYLISYLCGCLLTAIGFNWLIGTIKEFGGYSTIPAVLVFALFVLTASLQFLLIIFIYRHLKQWQFLERFALSIPLAWCCSEFITWRIFPWYAGHMQIAFTQLAQAADIAGAGLVSFLVFWLCTALVNSFKHFSWHLLLAPLCFILAVIYGQRQIDIYSSPQQHSQRVAVIQANITVEEKHNAKFFAHNANVYAKLTQAVLEKTGAPLLGNTLVIWPETVIMEFIYSRIGDASRDARLPFYNDGSAFLVGTLAADKDSTGIKRYNSALAIYPDGSVPLPYYKRILMPFGEYIPLIKTFPWLAQFNPMAANAFDAGDSTAIFDYKMLDESGSPYLLKVSPLICYEEILPSLARDAVNQGAEVLISLSNDAWFGKSIAPAQHHLIAAFRAIENHRYLIRSTNSGLTAIVTPLGETTHTLPVFSDSTIVSKISPFNVVTFYAKFGDLPCWMVCFLVLIMIIFNYKKRKADSK